jgi:hypothetical protein
MSTFDSLLKYLQHSERLVVVTLTITIAGLACFAAERWQVFDFSGLPEWARPTALIIWTVSAVHVAIRTAMAFSNGAMAAARFVASIPQRRRRAAYERPLIERLLATKGLEREILCYALRRDEDHIWIDPGDNPRWLRRLKQKDLLERSGVGVSSIQYRVHSVAWKFMQEHPNKFINLVPWSDRPWTLAIDEDDVEKKIQEIQAQRRA